MPQAHVVVVRVDKDPAATYWLQVDLDDRADNN